MNECTNVLYIRMHADSVVHVVSADEIQATSK